MSDANLSMGGTFWIDSEPDKAGTIKVRLAADQSIDNFKVSLFGWGLKGDDTTKDITLEDIAFTGYSNTGFTGAISLPGSGWKLTDISVSLANTIGIELGQRR